MPSGQAGMQIETKTDIGTSRLRRICLGLGGEVGGKGSCCFRMEFQGWGVISSEGVERSNLIGERWPLIGSWRDWVWILEVRFVGGASSLFALLLLLLLLSKLLLRQVEEILTRMRQSFYFTGEATANIHLHDRKFIWGQVASTPFICHLGNETSLRTFCLGCFERKDLTQTNLLEKNRNPYSEAEGVVA